MTSPSPTAPHPCLGPRSAGAVRLHLPVAVRASARSRFAPAGEAPGALAPEQAMDLLDAALAAGAEPQVIAITGPGDPLAAPGPTLEALRLARARCPRAALCLTTLGLGAGALAPELAAHGVGLVTLLVDAVSPEAVQALYAWIRPGVHTVALPEAARALVEAQAGAVSALRAAGIAVKINTTVYAGVNDAQVEPVAATMAALGAGAMQLMPYAGADDDWAALRPGPALMARLRTLAARHLPLLDGKARCGAPAPDAPAPAPGPGPGRPNVAVCSLGGVAVDQHLGQAARFLIYGPEGGLTALRGVRPAPAPGGGDARWEAVAELLDDCFALLASGAGEKPRAILARRGLRVLACEGGVEGAVDALLGGANKGKRRCC
ncbi:NifB/NifX family molybdenum-iron cluster-binding protein [Desulfocurvus vexinensis]|uniref:NifB/NifX family molybdenum-iron cluster-binding protein n=1 Tax=Desulfocurvus vexinensis TaxID=399548 RepID=UPI00048E92DB|nr:NifB/NifX family molybdenum-iron cluster-binding protein [Desulfocurvus vexinensis]